MRSPGTNAVLLGITYLHDFQEVPATWGNTLVRVSVSLVPDVR